MAKTWELQAFTITVEDEGDRPRGAALSSGIKVEIHKDTLAPFEACHLADALIRAMHEVTYHRFMRDR